MTEQQRREYEERVRPKKCVCGHGNANHQMQGVKSILTDNKDMYLGACLMCDCMKYQEVSA